MTLRTDARRQQNSDEKDQSRVAGSPAGQSPTGSTAPTAGGPQHSPLPWRIEDSRDHEDVGCLEIAAGEDVSVAEIAPYRDAVVLGLVDEHRIAEGTANAAFIVRCVNSHQALIAALTIAQELLDRNGIHRPEIDAALAKATGESK